MAPQKSSDKYIINIICDYSIATQFERLKLPSPQQLLSSANSTNPNGNDSSDLLIAPTNNVCALCEDVGMERAALIVVTSGAPYMRNNLVPQQNSKNNNHQEQQGEFEICCVVITLPQEIVRQLYKQGTLLKFLKDGLETIQDKYYFDYQQNKKKIIFKAFLVVEMPKNSNANAQQQKQQSEDLTDASILAELMILQSATEGSGVISHCSFVNASPPSSAKNNTSNSSQQTNNSNSSHNQKDDVASFIQALGLYLGRKAASIAPSNNNNADVSIQNEFFSGGGKQQGQQQQDFSIFSNFRSKVRDRDDSYTLLDPQFLTRGKIDTADWTAAYRGFLCEIEGITPQKAVSIISKFPTFRCLLDAIARKDQRSLTILADSVGGGGGGGNNRRVGDALVQKIIDKMTTKFDVKVALSSNARSFCQQ